MLPSLWENILIKTDLVAIREKTTTNERMFLVAVMLAWQC